MKREDNQTNSLAVTTEANYCHSTKKFVCRAETDGGWLLDREKKEICKDKESVFMRTKDYTKKPIDARRK